MVYGELFIGYIVNSSYLFLFFWDQQNDQNYESRSGLLFKACDHVSLVKTLESLVIRKVANSGCL